MKRLSVHCVATFLAVAIAGQLCGCSAGSDPATEPQQAVASPVMGPSGLPGISDLAGEAARQRFVSSAVISLAGSSHEPGWGQLVSAEDSNLRFTPAYTAPGSGSARVAYAMYRFNLQGVNSTNTLDLSWTTPPGNSADLWLGLSRWGHNRWEWHPGPEGEKLVLGPLAKLLYSHPTSENLYAVVLLTGTTEAVLERVSLNGNSTLSARLTASPTSGAPPLMVSFDASGSSSSAGGIARYEWDFDGNGSWDEDTGVTPSTSHEYAAGSYTAWVRVTDTIGSTATASFSLTAAVPNIWAMFGRDAQRTSRSPYVGAQTSNLKWTYTTGGWVESSPAIGADGTVYVGSNDFNLYALNPDGSLKWSYTTGSSVASSPAIGADGTVYVGCGDGNLYALNPNGSLKWAYQTGSVISRSSPAIGSDGTVYIGSWDRHLHAVNPDGSQKWSYKVVAYVYSSPAIGLDGTVYVGSRDDNLYAINPDGSLKWTYNIGSWVHSPAVGDDGTIYVGGRFVNFYAINTDGSLKWSTTSGGGSSSSPAIGADGIIYVTGYNRNFCAVNPDGSEKWSHAIGGSSPAIGADGTVYVGMYDKKFYAINPDGSIKWSANTGGASASSPAIGADGTVYVGCNDRKLYAFGP